MLLHPADDVLWRMTPSGQGLPHGQRRRYAARRRPSNCARYTPRDIRPGRCAGMRPSWAPCSAATPCSRAAPARQAGRTPTSPPSSSRSRAGSASCPATPSSTPGHGDSTTIGDEIVHYDEWVARGPLVAFREGACLTVDTPGIRPQARTSAPGERARNRACDPRVWPQTRTLAERAG